MAPGATKSPSAGWGSRRRDGGRGVGVVGAVEDLLAADERLLAKFCRACSEGLPALRELGLPVREELVRRGHRFEKPREELAETLAVLYDLAHELLPASPAAALGRLRKRVAGRDGEPRDEVEAIEDLVASDPVAFDELVVAAERESDGYVRVAAKHLWEDLALRGQKRWPAKDFAGHVRVVMMSVFGEPWFEAWARSERRRALTYICSRAADGELPDFPAEYAEVFEAEGARDPARFSAAIRALVRSGLGVLRREGRLVEDDAPPGSSSAA